MRPFSTLKVFIDKQRTGFEGSVPNLKSLERGSKLPYGAPRRAAMTTGLMHVIKVSLFLNQKSL